MSRLIQRAAPAIIALLIVSGSALAQTPEAAASPKYWIAAGGGYNGGAPGAKVGGLFSIGVKLNATTWSYTTQETRALGASMRTGLATVLYQSGSVVLLGLADAGMATGPGGSLGGAFSGGGVAAFKLDRWLKQPGVYLGVDARITKMDPVSTKSQPTISLVLAKSF